MHTVIESLKKYKTSPILHPFPPHTYHSQAPFQEGPADAGVLGPFQGYSEHVHMLVQHVCVDALPLLVGADDLDLYSSPIA